MTFGWATREAEGAVHLRGMGRARVIERNTPRLTQAALIRCTELVSVYFYCLRYSNYCIWQSEWTRLESCMRVAVGFLGRRASSRFGWRCSSAAASASSLLL